jgi:two-component sensor histidine kinase
METYLRNRKYFESFVQVNTMRITKLLRQQAALASFGGYAFRERDLGKILNEAARVCAEGLGVAFSKICQYREAENDLLIVAGHGWHPGIIGQVVSRADATSPQGRAYTTRQPVIIYDLPQAGGYAFPEFYLANGILSTVDVVIKRLEGRPFGVLEIDSTVQITYDEHDVNFLTGFANILAEAVATGERENLLMRTIAAMEAAVAEKDALITECDILAEELKHRVRNNLQLVYAMLASHLKLTTTPEAKASMQSIIRRVITLAEVYEQLLGTGLGTKVDLGAYLAALCESMPRLQDNQLKGIRIVCETETITVGLDTVTAIGMVVAELVANSYDHAFPNGAGVVTVKLSRVPTAEAAILTVSDTGIGFIEQPGSKRHGVGLVHRLAQQVDGTAELQSRNGTVWTIGFPVLAPISDAPPPAA